MHSSEALRRRAAEWAAADPARPARRIIAAEQLRHYVPFAMDELSRERARSFGDGAAEPDERRHAARHFADFNRQDDPAASETADYQVGYQAGLKAGREAGFADGVKRGFEAGTTHAERERRQAEEAAGASLAQRVQSLHAELQTRFEQIEREAADEVVALALEVARHALRATLAVQPESIVPIVQEALTGLLDDRVRVQLLLNPADIDIIQRDLGERLAARGVEIVADRSLTPGGCRLETPLASVDATIETRWRRTLAALGRDERGNMDEAAA
ncbi:MAG: FliH/SctL family protein [Burkholderiaceae bacterium]